MQSPWLLFSLLFTLARSISGFRHPSPGVPETPTCEQLRAFWEIFSRAAKMGQVTNEIPILPPHMHSALDHLMALSGRRAQFIKSLRKNAKASWPEMDAFSNHMDVTNPFSTYPWVLQQPNLPNSIVLPLEPETPSDQDLNGIFGEFHEQSSGLPLAPDMQQSEPEMYGFGSSSGTPLSAKKNGEVEVFVPQYGEPEEVDTFGDFVDIDLGSPHFAITRTPKDVSGKWSNAFVEQDSSQVSCDVLVNAECIVNEQCICQGLKKLMCIGGKCLNHEMNSGVGGKYGIWHDGPVPQSQLRLLSRLRKRSNKSIFM